MNKGYSTLPEPACYQWLIPLQWGGLGLDYPDYIKALTTLARADAGLAVAASVHHSVCVVPLLHYGTPDQQRQWLPQLTQGPEWGAFALTEPNSGSQATAAQLKATLEHDHYVLNGQKIFITNALQAKVFIIFAQVNNRLTAFILPNPTPGLAITPGDEKLGLHTSTWGSLHLDNVKLPIAARLGEEGQGATIMKDVLVGGRIGIAAIALGLAEQCLEIWQTAMTTPMTTPMKPPNNTPQQHPNSHEALGLPLLDYHHLGQWHTQVAAAQQLVAHASQQRHQGQDATLTAAMAKFFASKTAFAVAEAAMAYVGPTTDAHFFENYQSSPGGLPGLHSLKNAQRQHLQNAWADAKALEIVEGTNEIQHIIIANCLLKNG
jgi:alkylation response protein AidB-like acyl-CoA dehydrogenase